MTLSYLNNKVTIKKKCFIQVYVNAHKEALTERTIKNEFKAVKIVLYKSEKKLNSLFIQTSCSKTLFRSLTMSELLDLMLSISRNSHQMQEMLKKLNKSESLNRSHKIFLKKTSDLIEKLNAQQTEQQSTIYKLSSQLKVIENKKRKKQVQMNSNTRFANIEKIKTAMTEMKIERQCIQVKESELQTKKAEETALETELEACMIE